MTYAPEAKNDVYWAFIGSPLAWALLYFVSINLVSFCAFGLDKWKAKRKEKKPETQRIPEKTLFLLALLGGGPGAILGMKAFHHKTLHRSFTLGIPAITIGELLLALGLFLYFHFFR